MSLNILLLNISFRRVCLVCFFDVVGIVCMFCLMSVFTVLFASVLTQLVSACFVIRRQNGVNRMFYLNISCFLAPVAVSWLSHKP